MADLKAFAEQLVNLTVKEVNELATIPERKNTVLNLPGCCCCCWPSTGGAAAAEEKTSFDVVLKALSSAKLQVVKAVKEACGLIVLV